MLCQVIAFQHFSNRWWDFFRATEVEIPFATSNGLLINQIDFLCML